MQIIASWPISIVQQNCIIQFKSQNFETFIRVFYSLIADGVLQAVLFMVLCFKWSVKNHYVAKIIQGIWERFLYEYNLNSCIFSKIYS